MSCSTVGKWRVDYSGIACLRECGQGGSGAGVAGWQIIYYFYLLSARDNDGLSMFNRNL